MAYEVNKPKKNWVTLDGEVIGPAGVNNILRPLTKSEAEQIAKDRKVYRDGADERIFSKLREKRNRYLDQTDWKVIKALEQGEELSEEFKTWRQNLRDIPQDYKASDYEKLMERDITTKELKHSVWQEPKE